ncbi:MAG: T9SS C-terminal target domain-containing protein, partial [Bacteroidales bacterium]|nr:T9SS C-terminal target domain-containing protein [Bacteroidales bacterium]
MNRAFTLFVSTILATGAWAQNTHNGHEYVDLGLTSGTMWATCNVGADAPEKAGFYYAWGETE